MKEGCTSTRVAESIAEPGKIEHCIHGLTRLDQRYL